MKLHLALGLNLLIITPSIFGMMKKPALKIETKRKKENNNLFSIVTKFDAKKYFKEAEQAISSPKANNYMQNNPEKECLFEAFINSIKKGNSTSIENKSLNEWRIDCQKIDNLYKKLIS